MDFLKFLNSVKTNKNNALVEEVFIPAYKSLFEEEMPSNPMETEALIQKTQKDLADLDKLKQAQQELAKNKEDLKEQAPELVNTTPTSTTSTGTY